MCIDGLKVADAAVWQVLPGPTMWPEFYSWARDAFALSDDSWNGAGAKRPWDATLPYGKMLLAIYLLLGGLSNDQRQFHSQRDYLTSARAADNAFHGPFYTRFISTLGSEAESETGRVAARDRTNFHCPLFDPTIGQQDPKNPRLASDDPANRAAVLVHESWHHWQHKYGYPKGHINGGKNGNGGISANLEGDVFYFHGWGAYPFDQLERIRVTGQPVLFHKAYQVAIEFCADLAEYASGWVPVVVTSMARAMGNNRIRTQCLNSPGFQIGNPIPF
jgi:hypothetical protein